MAWTIDEDFALKEKLSGYQVVNYADGRHKKIKVFFRMPDPEEEERTFPHLMIDLVNITADRTRTHRANGYIQWLDTEQATPQVGTFLIADDMPLPWSLEYQVSAFSRNPWDDRQLGLMMFMLFPEQYGFLDMTNFDSTFRRADLVSVTRRDMIDDTKKRLYRQIFTIAISSEFYIAQVQQIQQVTGVNVDYVFTGYAPLVPQ